MNDDGRVIQVRGVQDLQRALRQIDKSAAKELRLGLNEAAKIVADAARPLVPVRTGRARDSIKVGSTQRAAQIKVGGQKAPYYPWLDFGGRVGRRKSVRRQVIKGGRFIYPSLAKHRTAVIAKVDQVLERLAEKAGFHTEGHV